MKNWPKKNKTVDVESLLKPLAAMLRKTYKQKPNAILGFDYKGYRTFGDLIPLDERFTAESLKYNLEDQGYDLIDMVLLAGFQLGMEQSIRIQKKNWETIELGLSGAESMISRVKGIVDRELKERA